MTTMKTYDCVEEKHRAAKKVQAYLQGLTEDERIVYLRQVAAAFRTDGRIPQVPKTHTGNK
jgi:hypothetical protein